MDLKAKDYFYWPCMRDELSETVSRCDACQRNVQSQSKETMASVDIPDFPFQICASDLFAFEGSSYLLYVDSYSHWMSITRMNSTTTQAVAQVLQEHFQNFGVPELFISDGGPQYSSEEFQQLLTSFKIRHRKSSPTYAQSNGLAERYVQTAKSLMRKCKQAGQSLPQAMLHYRNTPVGRGFPSPAEMAFGRRLRCDLPATVEELRPHETFVHDSVKAFEKIRAQAAQRYNQGAKSLPEFDRGDTVWLQRGRRDWIKAEVTERVPDSSRSYIVRTEFGQQLRRNRRFLRARQTSTVVEEEEERPDAQDENAAAAEEEQEQTAAATETPAARSSPTQMEPRTSRGRVVRQTQFYQAGES
jgi:hypothetical protein